MIVTPAVYPRSVVELKDGDIGFSLNSKTCLTCSLCASAQTKLKRSKDQWLSYGASQVSDTVNSLPILRTGDVVGYRIKKLRVASF